MEKQTITLADQELASRLASRKHFLKDVDQLINWKRINKVLDKVEIRRTSVAGRDAFSAEVMFRIMLIQSWYKLSDYQMEEQLYYNNIFLWFCHLSLENPVPDHSTISRWRSRFSNQGIYQKLLQEINHQLSKYNIKVTEGVIVDATLVESHARPRKKEIIETEPVGDEDALQEKNLVSKIMQKKKKNQEMSAETRAFNHAISQQRYRVERSFGGLKKHFGWGRSIYMGLQKTTDYLYMGAIAFNLKRSLKILRA